MLFNSWTFAAFLFCFLAIHRFVPAGAPRRLYLVAASFAFYSYGDWRLVLLLGGYCCFTWYIGLRIEAEMRRGIRLRWLYAGIAGALLVLGVFKYLGFAVESIAGTLRLIGLEPNLPTLRLLLPIGISFFAFQAIAYLVDVHRGEVRAQRSLLTMAAFKSFFPQLVAGPIERAAHLMPQIENPVRPDGAMVRTAVSWIALGYLLKVGVADPLAPLVDWHFANIDPAILSAPDMVLAILAFGLQILGDFAGYSLIGRGVALLVGIELISNFNNPYISLSPAEFWRRWHISLSTWLRDYLFIPLGGNRDGKAKTYRNLMLTMTLGGFWHGAAWHFVLWGAYHGAVLCLARAVGWGPERPKAMAARGFALVATFVLVHIGWLFFRVDGIQDLSAVARVLWTDWSLDANTGHLCATYAVLLTVTLGACALERRLDWRHAKDESFRFVMPILIVFTLGVVLALDFKPLPFIYFQF
jgi:alginate O-acetyltransferase complex protein AlgI